jgi:hypothetical protein
MSISAMMQLLSHTPAWVWLVFVALAILGYQQTRERLVSTARLFILPAVFIVLAIYGIASAFGLSFLALVVWGMGFILPLAFAITFLSPKGVSVVPSGHFRIPGSWLPLTLMMAIFSIKYLLGVVSARHLPAIANPWFVWTVSFSLGVLSGVFFARNVGIWRNRSLEDRDAQPIIPTDAAR